MAATIGGVSCSFLSGRPAGLNERVQAFQMPGVDGYGAEKLGQGNAGFAFVAKNYASLASVETWITALEALVSTVVSATNDHGTTYQNLLVLSAALEGPPRAVIESGANRVRAVVVIQGVVTA